MTDSFVFKANKWNVNKFQLSSVISKITKFKNGLVKKIAQ